jgi:hypothetical protein
MLATADIAQVVADTIGKLRRPNGGGSRMTGGNPGGAPFDGSRPNTEDVHPAGGHCGHAEYPEAAALSGIE